MSAIRPESKVADMPVLQTSLPETLRSGTSAVAEGPGNPAVGQAQSESTVMGDEAVTMLRRHPHWIFAVAFLLVIAQSVAVWLRIESDRSDAVELIEQSNANLARAFEEHTIRTLKAVDQTVLFLKFQYEKYGDKIDIRNFVSEGVIIPSLFTQIGIIDENGVYILSNIADFKKVNLSDREHFVVHKDKDTGKLFVSKPVLGRVSGKWSLQLTRRINKPDGSFGGVVVVSLDPFYFSNFYSTVDLGQRGLVSLVGEDGIVRARHASGEAGAGLGADVKASSQLYSAYASVRAGSYRASSAVDKVSRFTSFRRLPEYPLIVLVGSNEREALAGFEARKRTAIAFSVGASLVILALAWMAMAAVKRQTRTFHRLVEARQRAESANKLKSEFLASMSHELRTPLNGILGYAELVRDRAEDDLTRECSQTIYTNGEHLLDLLNSILDLAKIEAGRMELVIRPEPIGKIMRDVSAIHARSAVEKGLTLHCDIAPEVPELFPCDRTRVVQILNNLLHNAIKFTDHGAVKLHAAIQAGSLLIQVRDTGAGIPADMHQAIFERFRQAGDFVTRSHSGSGLGLALCKELLGLMGGTISVTSVIGEGSCFQVLIPMQLTVHQAGSREVHGVVRP